MYYFGQSTWDSEVDRIFKQEYSDENHQLADMLASLESNLEKYEEYMKDQRGTYGRGGQQRRTRSFLF